MAPCSQDTRGCGEPRLHQTPEPLLPCRLAATQDPTPQASYSRAEERTNPSIRLLNTGPDRHPNCAGVILAGGRSRRMGRDKLPLKVGKTTLLDRVHRALASHCREILVVGAREYAPVGARLVSDLRLDEGPLAGIEAALLAARYGSVFVAAGDMPFLT